MYTATGYDLNVLLYGAQWLGLLPASSKDSFMVAPEKLLDSPRIVRITEEWPHVWRRVVKERAQDSLNQLTTHSESGVIPADQLPFTRLDSLSPSRWDDFPAWAQLTAELHRSFIAWFDQSVVGAMSGMQRFYESSLYHDPVRAKLKTLKRAARKRQSVVLDLIFTHPGVSTPPYSRYVLVKPDDLMAIHPVFPQKLLDALS